MANNILINGSFENESYRPLPSVDNVNVPMGFEWLHFEDDPNPYDAAPYYRPEAHILQQKDFPEPYFILDGLHTWSVFTAYKPWWVRITQWLPLSTSEKRYEFVVHLFPDLVKDYDGSRKIWADDPEGRDAQFKWHNSDGTNYPWQTILPPQPDEPVEEAWRKFSLTFSTNGGWYIGWEMRVNFGLDNARLWIDDCSLVEVSDSKRRGDPRVQYERTYVLLPAAAGASWAHAVVDASWDARAYTLGRSADDGGIGDLDTRQAISINPDSWGPGVDGLGLKGFYLTHYKGTDVRQILAKTPGDLEIKLGVPFNNLTVLQEYPTNPDKPDPPPTRKGIKSGFHLQAGFSNVLELAARAHNAGYPFAGCKVVHAGWEIIEDFKLRSPTTLFLGRYIPSEASHEFMQAANPHKFLDESSFAPAFDRMMELGYDFIESPLNEEIGTDDIPGIEASSAFDRQYAEWCYNRSKGTVGPATLTAGGGNPQHGYQTQLLIDAILATIEAGGVIAAHTYAPAILTPGVAEEWMMDPEVQLNFHLRPILSWQVEAEKAGVTDARYWFGEYGPITAWTYDDGTPGGYASAYHGWGHSECFAGDLPRLISYNVMYENLMQKYPNIVAASFFTSGRVDIKQWKPFQMNEGEWGPQTDALIYNAQVANSMPIIGKQ